MGFTNQALFYVTFLHVDSVFTGKDIAPLVEILTGTHADLGSISRAS